MDWHRVHAILDMVQNDVVIDSLQLTEECDMLQQSDHDSDTDAELVPDIDADYVDCKIGYKCKDRTILSKNPQLSSAANMVKVKEAIKLRKRPADAQKYCAQPRSAWQILFTDDLVDLIVSATNENILKNAKSPSSTNVNEVKTLIGILYFHGIMRPTHQKCSDLWDNEYGVICIRNAMKYERFKFLLENLSFFDEDDDVSIIHFDVMKRMRKVFEMFAMNCRTAFQMNSTAVIDEVIVPVYGPCSFRYDINKKPLKNGLKLVLLVDPSNFYVNNLDVITDHYFGPKEIVSKLVQHLDSTGITIMMDSWYTSLSLIQKLKSEYKLYSVAALNPNSDMIPPLFLSTHRNRHTFMTGFLDSEMSLTSYVNSESKSVNILTNHPKYYKRGHVNNTTVVSLYKKNQSAVEVLDVLMHYYTTMQNTNDWTLSLFFELLNIASVNAQVIWSTQNSSNVAQRRLFIKDLALSLLESDCEGPAESNLREFISIPANKKKYSVFQDMVPTFKNRRRCRICIKTTKRDRRTKQYCIKCGQFICREHTVIVCTMCM